MAVTIAQSSQSKAIALQPRESVVFRGTLASGTSTLAPKLSADNGATYGNMASPHDLTAIIEFEATFGWVELRAPTKTPTTANHYLFRLENVSGSDSWSVEGIPA